MGESNTKMTILEAAGRVVLERGVAGLTLDAVAQAAGLSKGGLIYHFASKEALLTAMVRHLIEVTESRIREHRDSDNTSGSWARGYVHACAIETGAQDDPEGRLGVALLTAAANNPALIAPYRERQDAWRHRLNADGVDSADAMIVRLAADGLWLNDVLDIPVLSRQERRAVLARLSELTRS